MLEEWFNILNWKALPAYGDIHNLNSPDFMNLYLDEDPEIKMILNNLLVGLRGEYPPHNLRIIGPPGIGKTSFILFLREVMRLGGSDLSSKYFFCVFHCDEFANKNHIEIEDIKRNILESVIEYFHESGISSEIINQIRTNEELNDKEKINEYLRYFEKHKTDFKRFIFVLDGVDTVSDDLIIPLVSEVVRHLGKARIKKWLCIRDIKYNSLQRETAEKINTFFPEPIVFPKANLNQIIQKRIKAVETKNKLGKNPYSIELCSFTTKLFNYDYRQSLAMLKKILEESPPKKIKISTSEEFIQKYLQNQSLKVFLKYKYLPNIFYNNIFQNKVIPLEKEILLLLPYRQRIDDEFITVLNKGINRNIKTVLQNGSVNIVIPLDDIESAIEYLLDKSLIDSTSKNKYELTVRGWELSKVVNFEYYIEFCKENYPLQLNNRADITNAII